MEYFIKVKRKKEKKKFLDGERNQAIWRGEWKHYTIADSNERKCARLTSEEKTHETIWMGEFPKDGSVSSSLCPFSYQGNGKHSSWPALSSFCYLPAEMHGKLMCRDLTILRSSYRSGTLLCMNRLQRGRMSSRSSRSCVQDFWAVP